MRCAVAQLARRQAQRLGVPARPEPENEIAPDQHRERQDLVSVGGDEIRCPTHVLEVVALSRIIASVVRYLHGAGLYYTHPLYYKIHGRGSSFVLHGKCGRDGSYPNPRRGTDPPRTASPS